MDQDRARSLLIAERDEVQGLLKNAEVAGRQDRLSEVDGAQGDVSDAAQPLTAEGMDDAIAESLRSRLDAIGRALQRLDEASAIERGFPLDFIESTRGFVYGPVSERTVWRDGPHA